MMQRYTDARRVAGPVVLLLLLAVLVPCGDANPFGTESLIPTNYSANQKNPEISGSAIVWDDPDSSGGDIFQYDISTGNITRLTDNPTTQEKPSISTDLIIWKDYRLRGTGDIYLFNRSTELLTRITGDNALNPTNIRMNGNKIVWQDDRNGLPDIYLYNIAENHEYIITPNTPASSQEFPTVSGHRIFWQDNRNSTNFDVEIFMNDTDTWTESLITPDNGLGPGNDGSTDGAWQGAPAASATTIVWEDNRNQDPSFMQVPNIYSYTFGGEEQRVSDDLTWDYLPPLEPFMFPATDGNLIVWRDYRNQNNGDIYLNYTGGVPPAQVRISESPDIKSAPKISGNRIVWTEENTGVSRIHLFTFGTSQVCPEIMFMENVTSGGIPLAVSFTDETGIAGISHWYWNFGDGTVSYEQNPEHAYTDAGQYSVNLTISDEYCRNISSDHIITSGCPAANFSASPTSGVVPLSVQFNDTSTGLPTDYAWDFENDGTIDSSDRNATHVYTVPGTYSVRLGTSNVYGTGTRTRDTYITVMPGAHATATTPVDGIVFDGRFGGQFLTYTSSIAGIPDFPMPSILISHPPASYGWQNITFLASDAIGFSDEGNGTYFGNVSTSTLQTADIAAAGFSAPAGDPVFLSSRMDFSQYPSSGSLTAEIWEGATATDEPLVSSIALSSGFTSVENVGYSAGFVRSSLGTVVGSTLNMSIGSAWVAGTGSAAAGRTRTYILTYGTDPSTGALIGTVFPTRYIGSDSTLDYFEADIPAQYSYFTRYFITQLSGSGNPLQLITLSVTSHVNPPAQELPSADSDSGVPGGGGGGIAPAKIIVPTTIPTPIPTQQPPDPGTSAKVYTNAQGMVSQATLLMSTDGRAIITLGEGVIAKDAAGKPLEQITMTAIPAGSLPSVPSGSAFNFGGMAYEIGPDGATFSQPLSLVFMLSQAQWGRDYTVRSFDQKTGTWVDLPTTLDAATGTVMAEVSHLCCFALFTSPVTGPPTPVATPLLVPAAPLVKAQPPTTAVNIFVSMIGWAADLMMNNAIVVVVVLILIIAIYLIRQGRFPGSGQ